MKSILFLFFCFSFILCIYSSTTPSSSSSSSSSSFFSSSSSSKFQLDLPPASLRDSVDFVGPAPSLIAFGSCHNVKLASPASAQLWDSLLRLDPDLFLWTGDVAYVDHRPYRFVPLYWLPSPLPDVAEQFRATKEHPPYARFARDRLVLGLGDDHDLNCNNGDASCAADPAVKALLLDFLGEDPRSPRLRQRQGLHASYLLGGVSLILLDTRSFRAVGGDLLGEAQWEWLERQLRVEARVRVVVSSVQVLPPDKPVEECWVHHPESLQRLLETLRRHSRGARVVLVSGDVHSGEILRDDCALQGSLYEITSSGMTHHVAYHFLLTAAASRLTQASYAGLNFGSIALDWEKEEMRLRLHDHLGEVVHQTEPLSLSVEDLPQPECPQHLRVQHREIPTIYQIVMLSGVLSAICAGLATFYVYKRWFATSKLKSN